MPCNPIVRFDARPADTTAIFIGSPPIPLVSFRRGNKAAAGQCSRGGGGEGGEGGGQQGQRRGSGGAGAVALHPLRWTNSIDAGR